MIRRPALAVLFIAAASCAASAAEWVERPYNPPIGSRWIVETKSSSEEIRQAGPRTLTVNARAELTIDGKTADGFRISYVSREFDVGGNSPNAELYRRMTDVMKGIVIRAQTDASGKPVRLENLEEVRTAMREIIARLKANFADKPALADAIEKVMTSMVMVDEKQAPELYLENLPAMATGQQTGLKPGDLRRSVEETPSPMGGGTLKSNIAFQIVTADAASGKVNYLRTSATDAESVKELTLKLTQQLFAAAGNSAGADKIESVMKQMDISMNARTEIEVEDGITRRVRDQSDIVASAVGQTVKKREIKTITMTPAR
jgi:DNA-binding FadR family transcriptional regulator